MKNFQKCIIFMFRNVEWFIFQGRNGLVDSENQFGDWGRGHQCSLQIYDSSSSHGGWEGGKEKEIRLPYIEEEIELHYAFRTFFYWISEIDHYGNGDFRLLLKLLKSVWKGCIIIIIMEFLTYLHSYLNFVLFVHRKNLFLNRLN